MQRTDHFESFRGIPHVSVKVLLAVKRYGIAGRRKYLHDQQIKKRWSAVQYKIAKVYNEKQGTQDLTLRGSYFLQLFRSK